MGRRLSTVIILLLLPLTCRADLYTGYLTADPNDPYFGLVTAGRYATGTTYPRIEWSISLASPSGPYLYEYWLHNDEPSPEHWILQAFYTEIEGVDPFDAAVPADIENVQSDRGFARYYTAMHEGGVQPNPNMPTDLYGIRWEEIETATPVDGVITTYFSFESYRSPVWGDFYVRAGGGPRLAEYWNSGWGTGTSMDYFLDPSADGAADGLILRPDGYIPEPATSALFGLGIAGLIAARMRRLRQ